jgi:pSer/pThr/pTyr-binding forkhead associated (FHA) protein
MAVNGVSRQHAILCRSDHGPVLVDLDSTNGTVINDFPLSPFQPYLLQDGDRVQFGDLLVKVYLKN